MIQWETTVASPGWGHVRCQCALCTTSEAGICLRLRLPVANLAVSYVKQEANKPASFQWFQWLTGPNVSLDISIDGVMTVMKTGTNSRMIPRWSTLTKSSGTLTPRCPPWNDPVLQCGLTNGMRIHRGIHLSDNRQRPSDFSKDQLLTTQESPKFRGKQRLNCKKLCVVSEFETLKNHGIIMFHIFLFCGDKKKRNLAQQVTIFHASAHAELVGFLLWDILRWRVAECCPFWWVYLLENLQETNSIYRIFIVFTCMYFRLILFTSHFHEGKYCRPPTEKPGRLAIQTWGITKSSRTAQLLWFLDKRYEPALSTVP